MRLYTFSKFFIGLIIAMIVACALFSCSSSKDIYKKTDNKDSSFAETLKEQIKVLTTERNHFEQRVKELENQEIHFDTTKCPPIPETPPCPGDNADSVNSVIARYNAIVRDLNALYSGAMNKVKILSDGTVEAEGRLSSYRRQKEKDNSIITDQQKTIDSMRTALSEKKVQVVTKTVEVEKHKKTSVLNFWWLLLIGVVIGFIIRSKIKLDNMKKIISVALLAMGLTSCGQHRDGTSVWAGGLWIIPFLLFGASGFFFYLAWRQSNSGSSKQMPGGGILYDEKMPIYKIWSFWFSMIFFVAGIVVLIMVNSDK